MNWVLQHRRQPRLSDTFVQRNTLALDMICLLLNVKHLIIKMKDGSEIFVISLIYPHIMSIIQSMGRDYYIGVLIAETFNSFLTEAQLKF